MADTTSKKREHERHPTEVFEDEIEELDRSTVRSWSSWLAGIGAFALLAGIVLMAMAYETRRERSFAVAGNLPKVALQEPSGTLDHLPSQFRWQEVSGAASYLVTILRSDSEETVLLRPTNRTALAPSADELGRFGAGRFHWTVEARGSDGRTRAWGEGDFELALPRD
jgi:hypothetical protein